MAGGNGDSPVADRTERSVLVVEDNQIIVTLLRHMLERRGYRVETAQDGRAAMARLGQEPPGLVLLDVMLPYTDGFEVIRQMRATPGWGELARSNAGPWSWLPLYSLSVLGWAGLASLDYSRKLARRLQLGLADAVTADRVRLWATAMLAAFATSAISLLLRALGVQMTATLTGLVVGPLGIVSAASMWLAFMPPRPYLRWVAARNARAH